MLAHPHNVSREYEGYDLTLTVADRLHSARPPLNDYVGAFFQRLAIQERLLWTMMLSPRREAEEQISISVV
jgi:hypothetical protein